MDQFYTLDGVITHDKKSIVYEKLRENTFSSAVYHLTLGPIILIVLYILMFNSYGGKSNDIGIRIMLLLSTINIFLLFYAFVQFFKYLFKESWDSVIFFDRIVSISEKEIKNTTHYNRELETSVLLTLKSGRRKTYIFRKNESYAQEFISFINEKITAGALYSL